MLPGRAENVFVDNLTPRLFHVGAGRLLRKFLGTGRCCTNDTFVCLDFFTLQFFNSQSERRNVKCKLAISLIHLLCSFWPFDCSLKYHFSKTGLMDWVIRPNSDKAIRLSCRIHDWIIELGYLAYSVGYRAALAWRLGLNSGLG